MHDELQYLNLVRTVLDSGELRNDRTGTGTWSIFSPPDTRWSLEDHTLPLLTTKFVPFHSVAQELLFFISGKEDTQFLTDRKVRIWDANTSRQALDHAGKHHIPAGHIGKGYGFQWRHFGACQHGHGVDQLAQVITDIKLRPHSRRHVVSAWNPAQEADMALPPCHVLFQFYVHKDQTLSCKMTQRSVDMGLGAPFNIASYSLLTHMIAHLTGLKARSFIHSMGDTHVYLNHIETLKVQLTRAPHPFPRLEFNRQVQDIDDFTYDDFRLVDYRHHPRLTMEMST
jgi:thymidylate synthase